MRIFWLTVLVLLEMSFCIESYSFATWNLRYANEKDSLAGDGWSQRVKPIADVIRFYDLDVVNLQEMDEVDTVPMVEMLLAHLPDYDIVTCGDSLCADFNPILYKKSLNVLDHGIFWFSETPMQAVKGWDARFRRYCTWAKFQLGEKNLFVFNVHWDHKGPKARHESALLSTKMVREIAGDSSLIYGGDLNCMRKYDCYQSMADDFWYDAGTRADVLYTPDSSFNNFQKNKPSKKTLDYIFVSNDIHVKRFSIQRHLYSDGQEWRLTSDHNPVVIQFYFEPKK